MWEVTDEVRASRLQRFVVPRDEQSNFESEKLWSKVSEAIAKDDQVFFSTVAAFSQGLAQLFLLSSFILFLSLHRKKERQKQQLS